jgi:hypothetical protein
MGLAVSSSIPVSLPEAETAKMKERNLHGVHGAQTSVPASGRRRLGAWLLLGWAAFWLMTVVEPGCSRFAAVTGTDQPMSVIRDANPATLLAESPPLSSHSDTDCPDLGAVCPGASNAVAKVTGRVDFLMTAPAVPIPLKPYDDAHAFLTSSVAHPPPPGAPLYLSTQRFRI